MNLTSKRMLQCLTAVAGVFAFTATAGQTWWGVKDAFENADGGTNGMAIAQYQAKAVGDGTTNYLWLAAETDASKIVTNDSDRANYGGINPITDPAANDLVLELATEGNTLTRHVIGEGAVTGRSFEVSSVFVDTLIKFTPSEDTPAISNDVKMAVYVNVNSNLVVYHKTEIGISKVVTNSVFDTEFINPTNWYRLTIEMGMDGSDARFRICLNSTVLTHVNAIGGGEWFYTAADGLVLKAVAFQGTGFVDELVVSDDADLGAGAAILLTLSYNDTLGTVLTNGVPVADGDTVESGTFITIDAADWYNVTNVLGVTYAGELNKNVATGIVSSATTATADITFGPYSSGSFPMGEGTPDAAKVAAWAIAKGGVTEADINANPAGYYDDYLLNTAPNPAATNTIAIDSIVVGTTNATIKVVASSSLVDFGDINGTLKIYSTTNLAQGFGTALEVGVTLTPAQSTNTVVITPLVEKSFIKATVE